MFFVQHQCIWFQKQVQKHQFWSRGGLQQNGFILRAGRCGAQFLPKKSRNTGDTRVWRWAIWNSHLWIFPGHLRSKKSLFPQWEPVFPQKCPKPTRKMTFLMSSWPFVALVLRIPWNTYKNSVLERVRLWKQSPLVWALMNASFGFLWLLDQAISKTPEKHQNFPSGKHFLERMCPKPARKVHFGPHLPSFQGSTPSKSPVGSKFGKNEWLTT